MGTVNVVAAEVVRAASADTHADLPKHAFGSCSICTRRLLATQQQAAPTAQGAREASTLPTRLLVQTSPVHRRTRDDGRA